MSEKISPEVRSRMMSGIRGTNTKPERVVRSGLHALGFRFRLHRRGLPGNPDLVLPKWKSVVFVHGCFWHGHAGCAYYRIPKTRTEFWTEKIAGNIRRDAAAIEALHAGNWRIAVVWECALRRDARQAVENLARFIASGEQSVEIGQPT